MQIVGKAGKFVIKLLQKEAGSIDAVLDLAKVISVQGHAAAGPAKEVIAAVEKFKAALAAEESAAAPAA